LAAANPYLHPLSDAKAHGGESAVTERRDRSVNDILDDAFALRVHLIATMERLSHDKLATIIGFGGARKPAPVDPLGQFCGEGSAVESTQIWQRLPTE